MQKIIQPPDRPELYKPLKLSYHLNWEQELALREIEREYQKPREELIREAVRALIEAGRGFLIKNQKTQNP